MRTTRIGLALLSTAAVAVALAGCSGGGAPGPTETVTTTATATATPTAPAADGGTAPSPTPSATCGPVDAATAVTRATASLPAPAGLSGARWDATAADTSGYDACAALSWSVVPVAEGTASSPNAILLFHEGRYLGTATKEQYPFQPTVRRTADDAIAVTYRYARASDANADPTGTTDATYTWDADAGRVQMTGDVPPEP